MRIAYKDRARVVSSDPKTLLTEKEYLAIERDLRHEDGRTWTYTEPHEGDAMFTIEVIGCDLRLEEVYAKVQLGEENTDLR